MFLLAQSVNDQINDWLTRHPLVLGGAASFLGLIFLALGIAALVTGRATAKRGENLEGPAAKMMGFIWLGFGVLVVLFGLYKIVSGLR